MHVSDCIVDMHIRYVHQHVNMYIQFVNFYWWKARYICILLFNKVGSQHLPICALMGANKIHNVNGSSTFYQNAAAHFVYLAQHLLRSTNLKILLLL